MSYSPTFVPLTFTVNVLSSVFLTPPSSMSCTLLYKSPIDAFTPEICPLIAVSLLLRLSMLASVCDSFASRPFTSDVSCVCPSRLTTFVPLPPMISSALSVVLAPQAALPSPAADTVANATCIFLLFSFISLVASPQVMFVAISFNLTVAISIQFNYPK